MRFFAFSMLASLPLKVVLPEALQSGHEYYCRFAIEVQVRGLASHELGQFVVDYLHHELARLNGRQHVHAESLLLDGVGKCLCNLIVYVSIEQCAANILQCLRHVDFGYLPFALQYLE